MFNRKHVQNETFEQELFKGRRAGFVEKEPLQSLLLENHLFIKYRLREAG